MFCWKADSLVSLVCGTGACRTLVPGDLSPKGAWERGQGGPPRWLGAVRAPATRAPGWAGDASAVRELSSTAGPQAHPTSGSVSNALPTHSCKVSTAEGG